MFTVSAYLYSSSHNDSKETDQTNIQKATELKGLSSEIGLAESGIIR